MYAIPTSALNSEEETYLPVNSYFGNIGRAAQEPDIEENAILISAVEARDEDIDVAFLSIEWFNRNYEP